MVLAEGTRNALRLVNEAVGDKELPVLYLLGERYVAALQEMASAENSKLVVIPGDLPAAVRGLLGGMK